MEQIYETSIQLPSQQNRSQMWLTIVTVIWDEFGTLQTGNAHRIINIYKKACKVVETLQATSVQSLEC